MRSEPERLDGAWLRAAAVAVLRHPSLWSAALVTLRRLAPRGWWRRRPFLPVPDRAYLRFRLQTMYGDSDRSPDPADVLVYLRWCRDFPTGVAHDRSVAGR
jgi:hypothetical protein